MSNSNDRTIQAYQDHVDEYINGGTPHGVDGAVKEWIDAAVASLSKDARILEFNSAFGRDAEYLKTKGLTVECTDATPAFVDLLNSKGFAARELNAITDDLGGPYDLVLANAVLLHFTPEELDIVLGKVFAALKPGGKFAFTVKQGQGEEWTDAKLGAPRYFRYWTEQELQPHLIRPGFEVTSIDSDVSTTRATWVQVIVTKPQA
jgi:SAM-dependent methyltransferase